MVAIKVGLFFVCLSVVMMTSSAGKSGGGSGSGGSSGGDSESNIANIASFTNFNKFGQQFGGIPGGQGTSGFSPETFQDLMKLAQDPCTMKTMSQFTQLMSSAGGNKGQ